MRVARNSWISVLAVMTAVIFISALSHAAIKSQLVRFETSDGWKLVGAYHAAQPSGPAGSAVVLLHGLAAGKGEWGGFQDALSKKGVSSLAIDLRGHGDSTKKQKRKVLFSEFTDRGPNGEWANLWKDAEAGFLFLEKKGYQRIGVAGASVGANVAAIAASKISKVHFLVLLSPGLDYQGLNPSEAVQAFGPRHLLLAASDADGYALQSSALLRNIRFTSRLPVDWAQTKTGHGVQMFEDPQMVERISRWILEDGK